MIAAADSPFVETMPIGLVTTEDGRTLLAVTEREDGMLKIVATPLTFIAQNRLNSTAIADAKTVDGNLLLQHSVFQINSEDLDVSPSETSPILLEDAQPPLDSTAEVTVNGCTLPLSAGHDALPTPVQENPETVRKINYCGRPKKSVRVTRLTCDICHQQFGKRTLYRKHVETHAEEKPHRCPKCPASFNVPGNFTLHMATHSTGGEPKCPECGKKFARMASLKSHVLLHEKEENLFCTECEDAFSTKAQLDAHLKHHGEKWTSEESRKCKLCSKRFVQPALYRLHIREHYRTKIMKQTKRGTKHKTMYKCTICLKSFEKPSQLMRHIRVHTGEKPFKCTVCGRAFTQKSSLQIHTWQHNGIRPHTCHLCNAKFSQKGNLNAHILRVHNAPEGEPIYGCTYCSCIFKKLGSLNGHIKRMHMNSIEESGKSNNNLAEADMRATVNNVISQLVSLESDANNATVTNSTAAITTATNSAAAAAVATNKKDILQQALKNSGLPSKNKLSSQETMELEGRTNFVTLLDRAPDGGGTRKYLTIRQRCVGNVRWYLCSFCHKEFKKPSDLIRHLRVHTQEKPFKCTYCYRSFALKSTMIAHERTHTGAKKYATKRLDGKTEDKCSTDKEAENDPSRSAGNVKQIQGKGESDLKAKANNSSNKKTKKKLSAEAESLARKVVLQEPLVVISDTGNRICVEQIPSKENGANSGNVVLDVARPHKCWVCQAAFRKISHLKQHYRRHTGERPYKCTKCDRRFTSNSVLKSHLHTHDDSRPYSCSICDTKFSTQSSMKRHLVTHSNKRPFMCPYCQKTFKTYVNCRKHMKIHKHELVQRQLEQEREINREKPSIDNESTSPKTGTTCCSTLSENNLALPETIQVVSSFHAHMASDFAQVFSQELQTITEEDKKKNGITETFRPVDVINLETAEMLHADETGTVVTLPSYTGEQNFTSESIREIEETLNQELLFNVGMNLDLEGNLVEGQHRIDDNASTGKTALQERDNRQEGEGKGAEEEQEADVASYERKKKLKSLRNNVFVSHFDSFDMNEIVTLADPDSSEIDDIGRNGTSMANILAQSGKDEQHIRSDNNQERKTCTQPAIVLLSKQSYPEHSGYAYYTGTDSMQEEAVNESSGMSGEQKSLLQCHVCSEQGFTAAGLNTHLKSHRGAKEYQCSECSLSFCTNGGLTRHSKTHTGKQQCKCLLCEKVFSSRTQLRNHQSVCCNSVSVELKLIENNYDPSGKMMAILDLPKSLNELGIELDSAISEKVLLDTVAEKDLMNRKNSVENEQKEYRNKCKYCPKSFRKPSDLVRHVRTHTGERPFKCDYCSKSFAVKCTLDSHRKVHTGKKTFRCHVCNSLFATKGSLKVHMRLHTGSKPFRCPICDLRFRTSGHRKVHLLKHAREQKSCSKRKQKHSKVSAIAQVAANLENSSTSVVDNVRLDETIPNDSSAQQEAAASNGDAVTGPATIYGSNLVETIGIETGDGLTGSQLSYDTTVGTNDILSINESNQLVANLNLLLASGLVTIHTEDVSLLAQSATINPACGGDVTFEGNNEKEQQEAASSMLQEKSCCLPAIEETPQRMEEQQQQSIKIVKPLIAKGAVNASKKECDICGKTFTKPYQVERHKRIHTGERPYKCELCTKSFAQKSTLQMHQKRHTGDRPHPCPHCEYSFTQKGNLRTHVKRVHQFDTLDIKKLRRTRRQNIVQNSLKDCNLTDPETKILSLDEISFVEFLR